MSVKPPQCHLGEGHCAASSTKAPVIGAKSAKPIAALATAYQRGCDRAPHTMMAPVPKTSPNTTSDADGPKGACSCATRHKPAPFQRLDKAMCVHWTHKGVRIAAMKVMAWCGTFGAGMGIGRFFIGDFIRLCCVSEVRSSLRLCRNKPERQSCALSQVNELGDGGGRRLTLPCCQLGLGRQRQQCGLAAANRAAASWRANRLNERRSTKVEWNVQCRLTGEHFEKIIVGNGHAARFRERPQSGKLIGRLLGGRSILHCNFKTWPGAVANCCFRKGRLLRFLVEALG